MGLRQSGIVSVATAKALDVPASVRASQLASSAHRLADLNFAFGERYVVVNLPATAVEAVENGEVVHRYAAIVGDVDHPSPEIAAHVAAINLNPTWTVPVSIIKKEIIPRMQRDPGYLTREKIRILDGPGDEVDPRSINWTTERAVNYTLRQDFGRRQFARLDPHRYAQHAGRLYARHALERDCSAPTIASSVTAACACRASTISPHGCWKGRAARRPAAPGTRRRCSTEIKTGAREDLKVTRPTPVIWVYLTGWANADGAANFRDDVYGLDAANGDATRAAGRGRAARARRHDRAMSAARPLQNRVDPYGALVAVAARGAMMGNRGGRIHRPDQTLAASPLGLAPMDRLRLRISRPAAPRLGRQLQRAVLSRRADGAGERPSAVLRVPARRRARLSPRVRAERRAAARPRWTLCFTPSGSTISPGASEEATACRIARRRDGRAGRAPYAVRGERNCCHGALPAMACPSAHGRDACAC